MEKVNTANSFNKTTPEAGYKKPYTPNPNSNWQVLLDLVRFSGGDNGQPKTAKGLKLSKNDGNIFAQAYEGDKRITLKLNEAETLQLAMALIKEYFNKN